MPASESALGGLPLTFVIEVYILWGVITDQCFKLDVDLDSICL